MEAHLRGKFPREHYLRQHQTGRGRFERIKRLVQLAHHTTTLTIPEPEAPDLPPELVVPHAVTVLGDIHIPYHEPDVLAKAIQVSRRDGIVDLVVNGDALDEGVFFMGGAAHTPHMKDFKVEVKKAREVFTCLLDFYERIWWCRGNHEARLFRLTNGQFDMETLISLIGLDRFVDAQGHPRVVGTDRDYLLVTHGPDPEDTWRVTHGEGGSVNHASNGPVAKATIYGTNVLQGHTHLWGQAVTADGRFLGATHGTANRPGLIDYKQLNTRTYRKWTNGFATIQRGKLALYALNFTDWERELAQP